MYDCFVKLHHFTSCSIFLCCDLVVILVGFIYFQWENMKLLQTKSLYYHKENLLNMYLYTLKNTIFERVKTIYQTLMFGKMFKKIDKKIVP